MAQVQLAKETAEKDVEAAEEAKTILLAAKQKEVERLQSKLATVTAERDAAERDLVEAQAYLGIEKRSMGTNTSQFPPSPGSPGTKPPAVDWEKRAKAAETKLSNVVSTNDPKPGVDPIRGSRAPKIREDERAAVERDWSQRVIDLEEKHAEEMEVVVQRLRAKEEERFRDLERCAACHTQCLH